MRYPLLALLWCALLTAVAAGAPSRVLDPAPHHLGMPGRPEWQEFADAPAEGLQLELTFDGTANTTESTIFIRQRDVKIAWSVSLNGRKLGTLETLAQPLVLALAVPAGTLRSGENRLVIARAPSAQLDDIVVGEITLVAEPRAAALGAAALEFTVTDAEGGAELPCRLTLVDPAAALTPWLPAAGQRLAVRTGVVYTGDGRARMTVPPGEYVVYASRGFEYSVATQRLAVAAGDNRRVALQLRREVPTPGLVACDSHIHTLTFSKHGDATLDERMLTIAGEGIELAIATDHNHHTDYTAAAARLAVNRRFTPVVGNEVTTNVGHFNAFPVPAGGPVPDARLTDWTALLAHIRSVTGAKVVTLNHPRDMHTNFIPFGPDNFDARTGEIIGVPELACDAVEVVTSAALQSDVMLLYHDWFALLNHGYRLAAIAASDTHQVSEFILGQARTYVVARDTEPAKIDVDEVCASYRAGRVLVSLGLLTTMTVDGRHAVGELATGLGPNLEVAIDVVGPSWVVADRVELFANGVRVRSEPITPTARIQKAHLTWSLPRPKHDVHLVAIATGPGVTAPYWETPRP
jgi:hypothetical protein